MHTGKDLLHHLVIIINDNAYGILISCPWGCEVGIQDSEGEGDGVLHVRFQVLWERV